MSESVSASLHRLQEGGNDWDDIPLSELNFWQKIAKKTRGIVTIGNAITVSGTVLVINGLYNFVNGSKAIRGC